MTVLARRGGDQRVWFRLGGALFEVVAVPELGTLEASARFHGLKDGIAIAAGSEKADVVAALLQPSFQRRR